MRVKLFTLINWVTLSSQVILNLIPS